jgi:hypothetical protein
MRTKPRPCRAALSACGPWRSASSVPRGSGRIEKACFFPTKACFFLGKHAFYGDKAQMQCLSPAFSVPKPEKHAYLPSKTEKACFFPIESMLFVGGVGIGGPKACFIRQIEPKPRIFGAFCPKSTLYVNKMGQNSLLLSTWRVKDACYVYLWQGNTP